MKRRLPLIIITLILIAGIVIGSFYDLQISERIFSSRDPFGITCSAFGMVPGYGFIAFLGGGIFMIALKKKNQLPLRIILFALGIFGIGISTWLTSLEFFSINGYYKSGTGYTILSYVIAFFLEAGFFVIGLFLLRNNTNDKMWIALLVLAAALIISLLPGTTLMKDLVRRPRYREVPLGLEGVTFHNWWEPCPNYKDLMSLHGLISEEFKSFPSGHAATTMLIPFFLGMLPVFVPKLMKYKMPLFYIGLAYCSLISFTRILVGAHYLSDVCFGALLTLTLMWIAWEIVIKLKLIEIKE